MIVEIENHLEKMKKLNLSDEAKISDLNMAESPLIDKFPFLGIKPCCF